jgi:F-type H+-transporting ATPase subunit gamma
VGNNLRDIRRRIMSVATMQKTTRAMKTVSAAKLGRATLAIAAARPYAEKVREVLGAVASGADPDAHPLLIPRPVRHLDVVVFASDRGLCGAFNANIIKRAETLIVRRRPELESVSIVPVGRKGADYFRRHRYGDIPRSWVGLRSVTPEVAREVAEFLMERFAEGKADETVLVYSVFQSALSQHPSDQRLLPLAAEKVEEAGATASLAYEFEPSPEALLRTLVPRAVEFAVFRALLENQAGEHGARMTAMDNATNNTADLIERLTLEYNKGRQAAITAELVEIVSAAEST